MTKNTNAKTKRIVETMITSGNTDANPKAELSKIRQDREEFIDWVLRWLDVN